MMETVECYSGQTYAERPKAFRWEGERLEVEKILTNWRTPEACHWLVLTCKGRFELCYKEAQDTWSISQKGDQGTGNQDFSPD